MQNTSLIHRAVVMRLYPSKDQAASLRRWQGSLRFLWNRTLDWCQVEKEIKDKYPDQKAIRSYMAAFKQRDDTKWIGDLPAHSLIQISIDLSVAFSNWFNSLSGKRKGPKVGFPVPKDKFRKECTVYIANTTMTVSNSHVKLPKLGSMKYRGGDLPEGRLLSSRIFRKADKWYMASVFECQPLAVSTAPTECVGIDMGLKTLATIYDGEKITEIPKLGILRKHEKRLKRYQRMVSRRAKGSKRRGKAKCRLAKLHQRISNIRKDYAHKSTNQVIQSAQTVKIENLNILGMIKNRRLAKSVADASMGMFLTMLKYKANWHQRSLVQLGRWEPSSKTCNHCGYVHQGVKIGMSFWTCPSCSCYHDRDANAAKNIYGYLENLGFVGAYREKHGNVAGYTVESAWTDEVTGLLPVHQVEARILKQNGKFLYYSLF